jgi:hypothetical protein
MSVSPWAEEYAALAGDSTIVQEFVQRQAEWADEVGDHEAGAHTRPLSSSTRAVLDTNYTLNTP